MVLDMPKISENSLLSSDGEGDKRVPTGVIAHYTVCPGVEKSLLKCSELSPSCSMMKVESLTRVTTKI